MATAKFHAIRIEHANGRILWYNRNGFGSLEQATLFRIRQAGPNNPWGQLHGESDVQGVYLQMTLMFPDARVLIAAVDEVVKTTRVVRDIIE